MKRTMRWLISSVAVAALSGAIVAGVTHLSLGSRAFAEEEEGSMGMGGGPHDGHGAMLGAHIDAALDAASVTASERAAVHAACDRAMAILDTQKEAHRAHMDQLITLFTADSLDGNALAELRTSEESLGKATADAVIAAVEQSHDALTPGERQKLVAFAKERARRFDLKEHPRMAQFIKGRMSAHVDTMLDHANVAAAERPLVQASVERVVTAFAAAGESHHAHLDQALALFAQNSIDAAAVAQLRQAAEGDRRATGDSIVQAIHEIHDALSPAERQALATQLRTHLAGMHGHRHG